MHAATRGSRWVGIVVRVTDERGPRQEGTLELRDGRTLAWCEWGAVTGPPLLRLQGTPGCRLSGHPHREIWSDLGLRVVTVDRPGYGRSTPMPGRRLGEAVDDVVEALDQLGIERVHVYGRSGGGPHALALAARHPDRVVTVAIAVGAAPLTSAESTHLVQVNRAGWEAVQAGRQAVVDYLTPLRAAILADPVRGFVDAVDDAPETDRQIMSDADWQRGMAAELQEALSPGVEGWVDDTMAILGQWDIDLASVRCPVTWYHGARDANAPLAAARRVVEQLQRGRLVEWGDVGHMVADRHERDILGALFAS